MTAALQDPRLWEIQRRRFPIVVECAMPPGDEPCTQVQCRYHLAQMGVGDHRREATRDCALSVANEGPRYLDEVAAILDPDTNPQGLLLGGGASHASHLKAGRS